MTTRTFEVPAGHPIPTGAKMVGIRRGIGHRERKNLVEARDFAAVKELAKDPRATRLA